MGTIIIVAMVFGSLLALVALICGTILMIVRTRNSRIAGSKNQSEEARVIQEIYQGLSSMEQRIESLETILMDNQQKNREKDKYDDRL